MSIETATIWESDFRCNDTERTIEISFVGGFSGRIYLDVNASASNAAALLIVAMIISYCVLS